MPDDVLNGILDSTSDEQSANSTGRTPLVIDSDLRTIQVPTDYVFGVQNDKDVLSVPFIVPRYYDGVDLSELSIRVNFTTKSGLSSYYDVETITINPDTIEFSWLLGAAVFVSVGDLTFAVCIRNIEADGRITREFNTTLATAKILPGLEVENPEDPSQYSILVQMQNIAERAESYVGAPLTALTEDDMTDTSRIYVYVGEETGYANGHWYYYSDDVWHDGGIYNAVAQLVDDTLTEEGVAADAKATGDAINEAIAELDNSIQNGIYPDLYAGNLTTDKAQTDRTPYLQRATCNESGSDRIGQRCYETIVGASVGENQIFNPSRVEYGAFPFTKNGIEFTLSSEGRIILNGTATDNTSALGFAKILSGHKYYRKNLRSNAFNTFSYYPLDDESVVNATGDNEYAAINIQNGTTVTNYEYGGMIIDLTTELGSTIADYIYSLETATAGAGIAKLREWGFLRGYQAFNAGSIESVEVTGKKVVGFNQFDKDAMTVNGEYIMDTTGEAAVGSNYKRTDYIPVIGGKTYYVKTEQTNGGWGAWYDADKNYISGCVGYYSTPLQTAPANARYIRLTIATSSGGSADTFCFSLSSDRNGEYEPYTEQIYDYGTDTLNGIFKLDANNQLYADGDVKTADGLITRKYSLLDLGTQTWTKSIDGVFTTTGLVGQVKEPATYNANPNLVCSKYLSASYVELRSDAKDKTVTVIWSASGSHGQVWVRDSAYTDASTFATAMSGTYLVYPLATPTTEQGDPFPSPQVCYPYGTEEYITETPVPVGHETIYPYDLKAQAERLIDVPDVPSTNGTYVLKATRTSSGLTYSWVSG